MDIPYWCVDRKSFYKDDKLDGEFFVYYDNGQVQAKGIYKENLLQGDFTTYDRNGKVLEKTNYENGREVIFK